MMSEHKEVFDKLFFNVDTKHIKSILDAGSGETSLTLIHNAFPSSQIDAVVFPGDVRKRKSVGRVAGIDNLNFIEADIAKTKFTKKYDIVFAHLLLGEAVMWGHSVSELLIKLFAATKEYLVVIDFPEDPEIDFDKIIQLSVKNEFTLIEDAIVNRKEPFVGKEFVGNNYRGLLFAKSKGA